MIERGFHSIVTKKLLTWRKNFEKRNKIGKWIFISFVFFYLKSVQRWRRPCHVHHENVFRGPRSVRVGSRWRARVRSHGRTGRLHIRQNDIDQTFHFLFLLSWRSWRLEQVDYGSTINSKTKNNNLARHRDGWTARFLPSITTQDEDSSPLGFTKNWTHFYRRKNVHTAFKFRHFIEGFKEGERTKKK